MDTLGVAPTENLAFDESFDRLEGRRPEVRRKTPYREVCKPHHAASGAVVGLEEIVQTGRHFQKYEIQHDGTVIAYFADGSAIRTNLWWVPMERVRPYVGNCYHMLAASIPACAALLARSRSHPPPAWYRSGFAEYNVNIRPRDGRGLMITSHRVNPAASPGMACSAPRIRPMPTSPVFISIIRRAMPGGIPHMIGMSSGR